MTKEEEEQQHLEENKRNVMAFYDLAFNQNNPAEAISKYVGEVYISTTQRWPMARRLSLSILREWQRSTPASVFTLSVR